MFWSVSEQESDEGSSGSEGFDLLPPGRFDLTSLNNRQIQKATEFHSTHKKFFLRLSLATSVAFWVALFGTPVYSSILHYQIFGSRGKLRKTRTSRGETIEIECTGQDVGRMRNIAPPGEFPIVIAWNSTMSDWDPEEVKNDIWCGFLPRQWETYWPNIAQFIVFTVFSSTGDTVKLAWQGFIGTSVACVNQEIMYALFPMGANGLCLGDDPYCELRPYNQFVCFMDVFVVLFLFLVSKAEENTIKFGMSWHVCFMMDFMDPTNTARSGLLTSVLSGFIFDNEVANVFWTTIIGVIISIIATIFPRACFCRAPLLNRLWMLTNSIAVAESVGNVWAECIEYFCGDQQSAKRYQLEKKINMVSINIAEVKSQVANAWWETLGIGQAERVRLAVKEVVSGSEGVLQTMHALSNSIREEDFSGNHNAFCNFMKKYMLDVQQAALELTTVCAHAASDGDISEEEAENIKERVQTLRLYQAQLLDGYARACPDGTAADLSEEVTFCFSLSFWARTVEDFAMGLTQHNSKMPVATYWQTLTEGLSATFHPKHICETEHLKFALRNWIPICLCFLLGFYLNGSIWSRYSAVMPNTLALLITRFSGSAINKNLHRILGVMLGKFLPILLNSGLLLIECGSWVRGTVQFFTIYLFVSGACYVYFSSKTWSYMAVLIGGFGVYPLLVPCAASDQVMFASRYREIGEVTVAIVIQLVLESSLHAQTPPQLAVKKLQQATNSLTAGYRSFFANDLHGMQQAVSEVSQFLSQANDLANGTDPDTQLAPGWSTPFKIGLYRDAIGRLHKIMSDMVILVISCTDWEQGKEFTDFYSEDSKSSILAELAGSDQIKDFSRRILEGMETDFEALIVVLSHETETPVESTVMERMEGISCSYVIPPEHRERIYMRITNNLRNRDAGKGSGLTADHHARGTVAVRALENTLTHLEAMTTRIISEDVFAKS